MYQHDVARDSLLAGLVALIAGLSIGTINQWLQAGAFLVSIIAGLAATRYYLKKSRG